MIKFYDQLMEIAKKAYDNGDPSHDYLHILRVIDNCKLLSKDMNVDLEVLIPAAILHDVVFVPKNSPDRTRASEICSNKAEEILNELGYDKTKIPAIKTAILEHSFSRGLKPTILESKILQDADRLDGLGAIGVMRNITTGALMKSQYYYLEDVIAETPRPLDDKKYSIDHFFVKLFKLPELMSTEAGKKEAYRRVEFMKGFLQELKIEVQS